MLLVLVVLTGVSQQTWAADGEFDNISTRAYVGTGDEVMIGGFIIREDARKVAIHALGPELTSRSVPNVLADPVLRVIDTTDPDNIRELVFNDDWDDSQGQLLTDIWGSVLPFTEGSNSSAAVLTLGPGNYTAIVEGKNGTSGIALVEVWRIDSPGDDGNFGNISTRAVVRTGDEVMIGGFILADGPRQVAIHALGPELTSRSVPNVLADPVLRVIDTTDPGNPMELMFNDDWEDSQGQLLAALRGSALPFTAGSNSSAAVLTLDPGNYTAIVEGKNGTSGIALVEVYGIDPAGTGSLDREALMAFYHATDGPNWRWSDNWGTDAPLNQWYGVSVDGNGHVIELWLFENYMSGSIPPELGNLTNLTQFNFGVNNLSGEIPGELGNLVNLDWLKLDRNRLSGPIPAELGRLVNLQSIDLSENQLSGSIPAELGNLASLEGLDLGENQLSGPIPAELGNLASLRGLELENNQLSGSIPPELGNLANLVRLYLHDNQLSGSIPVELGSLANLDTLHLYDNQLSGPIPVELGRLAKLQSLNLAENQLSGPIPPELGNLTSLLWLWIDRNQLSGPIPAELSNIASLQVLDLEFNQLSGPIPDSFLDFDRLERFYLYGNDDLCVPAGAAFDTWLAGIPFKSFGGPRCASEADSVK